MIFHLQRKRSCHFVSPECHTRQISSGFALINNAGIPLVAMETVSWRPRTLIVYRRRVFTLKMPFARVRYAPQAGQVFSPDAIPAPLAADRTARKFRRRRFYYRKSCPIQDTNVDWPANFTFPPAIHWFARIWNAVSAMDTGPFTGPTIPGMAGKPMPTTSG